MGRDISILEMRMFLLNSLAASIIFAVHFQVATTSNWGSWGPWIRTREDNTTDRKETETSATCALASTSPTCQTWSEWSRHDTKTEICEKRNCTAYPIETRDCC